MFCLFFLLHILLAVWGFQPSKHAYCSHARASTACKSFSFQYWKDKLKISKPKEEPKSDTEALVDYVDYKPWRSAKVKNLRIEYKPWKESYLERFRNGTEDSVYLYSVPRFFPDSEATRVNELWDWPWLWTKLKAERLSWIMKLYQTDVASMSAQEHIELDSFFSEFDMPTRWGLVRIRELFYLNNFFVTLCFFTDLHGVRPTDLGVRPDGSVNTCPLQSQNCLSSSNDPQDAEHYAPPFRYSREKSPTQAYDEVKQIYSSYPKRGLRWSYGWIDRGGWKPQTFSSKYFYAQAESLAWRYTDDIELVLDTSKREVQFRSSARLGTFDFDVQRLRYNQFVRMLGTKGAWEVSPLPPTNYLRNLPYKFTEDLLDSAGERTERMADQVIYSSTSSYTSAKEGKFKEVMKEFYRDYVKPIQEEALYPLESQLEALISFANQNEVVTQLEKELQSLSDDAANLFSSFLDKQGGENVEEDLQNIVIDTENRLNLDMKELRDSALLQIEEKIQQYLSPPSTSIQYEAVPEEKEKSFYRLDREEWLELRHEKREGKDNIVDVSDDRNHNSVVARRFKANMLVRSDAVS